MSSILWRTLIAVLPLPGLVLTVKDGFVYGILGGALLLFVILLFFLIHRLIPERMFRLSFFLLLILVGVRAVEWILSSSNPLSFILLASLALLTPPDLFRKQRNWRRIAGKSFLTAVSFWFFLAGHGIFSELLGRGLGIQFFQNPAGSYFLAGLLVTFLPPGVRK